MCIHLAQVFDPGTMTAGNDGLRDRTLELPPAEDVTAADPVRPSPLSAEAPRAALGNNEAPGPRRCSVHYFQGATQNYSTKEKPEK